MLKPTGFRKKPHTFTQSVDSTPIEIEFFGAIGITSEEHAIDAVKTIDSSYNDSAPSIFSGFDLEVRLMGSNEIISATKNIKIEQLKVTETTLSSQTLI
jgi:hypothetical protein